MLGRGRPSGLLSTRDWVSAQLRSGVKAHRTALQVWFSPSITRLYWAGGLLGKRTGLKARIQPAAHLLVRTFRGSKHTRCSTECPDGAAAARRVAGARSAGGKRPGTTTIKLMRSSRLGTGVFRPDRRSRPWPRARRAARCPGSRARCLRRRRVTARRPQLTPANRHGLRPGSSIRATHAGGEHGSETPRGLSAPRRRPWRLGWPVAQHGARRTRTGSRRA
jgi:hypothetical protein